MSRECETVEEAIVCGQEMSESAALHLSGCTACQELQSLSGVMETCLPPSVAEPPSGYATRLQARARSRRGGRFRIPELALVLGSAAAVGALLFFVLHSEGTRGQEEVTRPLAASGMVTAPAEASEWRGAEGDLAAELAALADVEKSLSASADWDTYLAPVATMETLSKELMP